MKALRKPALEKPGVAIRGTPAVVRSLRTLVT